MNESSKWYYEFNMSYESVNTCTVLRACVCSCVLMDMLARAFMVVEKCGPMQIRSLSLFHQISRVSVCCCKCWIQPYTYYAIWIAASLRRLIVLMSFGYKLRRFLPDAKLTALLRRLGLLMLSWCAKHLKKAVVAWVYVARRQWRGREGRSWQSEGLYLDPSPPSPRPIAPPPSPFPVVARGDCSKLENSFPFCVLLVSSGCAVVSP